MKCGRIRIHFYSTICSPESTTLLPGYSLVISSDFLHRSDAGCRKRASFGFKVTNNVLNNAAQLSIELDRFIAMDPSDQIRAPAKVDLILIAPFHPLVISIARLHFWTSSMARFTWRS
jgi:hypothetical protein